VPARRSQVAFATAHGPSQRRAWTLMRVSRSALHYPLADGREGRASAGADGGAVGAVSALRLPPHLQLSRTRRARDELWPGASPVAVCTAAGAAQTATKAGRHGTPPPEYTNGREPGVKLRLRIRLVREGAATRVSDRHRRVDGGTLGDRGRRPAQVWPRDRGAVTARLGTRRAALYAFRQRPTF
jgi:hypothetical protein